MRSDENIIVLMIMDMLLYCIVSHEGLTKLYECHFFKIEIGYLLMITSHLHSGGLKGSAR